MRVFVIGLTVLTTFSFGYDLMSQDFDTTWTANSPPDSWRIFHTDTSQLHTMDWHRENNVAWLWPGHPTPFAALFWNVNPDPSPDSLVSVMFDCSGYENVTLRCSTRYARRRTSGFHAYLAYSVNGGATFAILRDYSLLDSVSGEETYVLSEATDRDSVVLAWVFEDSSYNMSYWCVDDVVVSGDSILDWDIACSEILDPNQTIPIGTLSPNARFANLGLILQTNVVVGCSLYDSLMNWLADWTDTILSISPQERQAIAFSPAYNFTQPGDSYLIKFWCAADSDYDRSNDTLDRCFDVTNLTPLGYCSDSLTNSVSWPVGHHGWGVKFGIPGSSVTIESLQVYLNGPAGAQDRRYQLALVKPGPGGRPIEMFHKTPVLTAQPGWAWNSVFMADSGEKLVMTDSFYLFYLQVGEPPECPSLGRDDSPDTAAQYWKYMAGAYQEDTADGDYGLRVWVNSAAHTPATTDARCLFVDNPWYEFIQRPYDTSLQVTARIQNAGATTLGYISVRCTVKTGGTVLFYEDLLVSNVAPGADTLVSFSNWVDTLPGTKACSVIVRTALPIGLTDEIPLNDDKRFGFDLLKGAHTGVSGLGYSWIDSDTTGGPTFNWIDTTSGNVSTVMSVGDDNSQFVPIGFDFPYYDTAYNSVIVNANGWLSFGLDQGVGTPHPLPMPDDSLPNNAAFVWWDDLEFGVGHGGGWVYRVMGGQAPNRWCAIVWESVMRDGSGDTTDRMSFEAVLHENGMVDYQYKDVECGDLRYNRAKNAGIGSEDRPGTDGLCYLYARPPLSTGINDLENRVDAGRAIRVYRLFRDAAALDIVAPEDYSFPGLITPVVRVQNYGSVTDTIRVYLTIKPGTPSYQDSAVVPGLPPGDSIDIPLLPWDATLGNYTAICSVRMQGDVDSSNNQFSKLVVVSPWIQREDIPYGWRRKRVKAAALCYASTTEKLYALKGSNTNEFWTFDPATGEWDTLKPMPTDPSGRKAKEGCDLAFDPNHGTPNAGLIWAIKGGGRNDFYAYDIANDTWLVMPPVFIQWAGYRPPKRGAAIHYSPRLGAEGKVYCIPGNNSLYFWRYDIADSVWEVMFGSGGVSDTVKVPVDPTRRYRRVRQGADIAADFASDTIYVVKGNRTLELYGYSQALNSWVDTLDQVGWLGDRRKYVKAGGSMTYLSGELYVLKGGNTNEFWSYSFAEDSWKRRTEIPYSVYGRRRKVKRGSALESGDSTIYALKGSYTYEFWEYGPADDTIGLFACGRGTARSGVAGSLSGTHAPPGLTVYPNPTRGVLSISYHLPTAARARVRIYDASGQLVRGLVDSPTLPGRHTVRWDGRDSRRREVAAGVYFVKFTSGTSTLTRKLVIER